MRMNPRPALRCFDPDLVRQRLADGWPGLMLRKFTSDQDCADFFGRKRQTGSNWRGGHCKPDAPALALAWLVWEDELRLICGGR